MSHDLRSLVWRLARTLRYQAVEELTGRRVEITDSGALGADVQKVISAVCASLRVSANPVETQEHVAEVLAKYPFVDLRFRERSIPLQSLPPGGAPLLKEMGFVYHEDTGPELGDCADDLVAIDRSCLEGLYDEARAGDVYLLVFLHESSVRENESLRSGPKRDPVIYPLELIITDACLTNAPLVWLNRHFYW